MHPLTVARNRLTSIGGLQYFSSHEAGTVGERTLTNFGRMKGQTAASIMPLHLGRDRFHPSINVRLLKDVPCDHLAQRFVPLAGGSLLFRCPHRGHHSRPDPTLVTRSRSRRFAHLGESRGFGCALTPSPIWGGSSRFQGSEGCGLPIISALLPFRSRDLLGAGACCLPFSVPSMHENLQSFVMCRPRVLLEYF